MMLGLVCIFFELKLFRFSSSHSAFPLFFLCPHDMQDSSVLTGVRETSLVAKANVGGGAGGGGCSLTFLKILLFFGS